MKEKRLFEVKSLTRRSLLKHSALAGAAAISAPYVISPARAAPTEVTMLAWYGHAEPDIVADFEAQHNVKVKPKYYTGGDNMLALIAQSPPGTYDLILSDAEYVQQLNAAGYIEQLDAKDYPFDDYFPEFQHFPGHWDGDKLFSVMARFGFLGVAYNTEAVSEADARSYKVYWDPAYEGKLGHFDWHLPNLGEISLHSGNTAPFDLDGAAWEKVQEATLSLRPQVGGFFDYGGTFSSLKSGQMALFCGIGDWITGVLQKEGAKGNSVVPEEGGLQWTVGAVLVHGGEIVSRGRNRQEQSGSNLLHAEGDALERAGRRGRPFFRDCELYTTLSPCSMCAGAVLFYEIPRIIVGDVTNYPGEVEWLRSRGVEVVVEESDACVKLLRRFMEEKAELWTKAVD